MKLTKCNNRHFYDADEFDECPHCNKSTRKADSTPIAVKPDANKPVPGEDIAQIKTPEPPEADTSSSCVKPRKKRRVNHVRVKERYDKTPATLHDLVGIDPIVGWLACVKGEHFGQTFTLKSGRNFIGRASNMDVALTQDSSVSDNKHAIITYDPQNRIFYVQPGESAGLTYFNETLLLAYQQIKAYEKVRLGKSELIFIPFCGEQFAWEDYIK